MVFAPILQKMLELSYNINNAGPTWLQTHIDGHYVWNDALSVLTCVQFELKR